MARLDLQGISKRFDAVEVLKDVSLSIADGEFVALVGPSGCGKSTLLRIIAGLDHQSTGRVSIGDRAVDGLRPAHRDIAMVFQSYALYPHMTARQNMAVPLAMRRLAHWQRWPLAGLLSPGARRVRADMAEDIRRTARMLDIEPLLDRRPAEMSGGQRQRVALGRALVRQPVLFLMDEPLSNLDAKLRAQMRVEIVELQRRFAITMVYVTHDQAEAMTMADRIAVMMDGEILQLGSPKELYGRPRSRAVAEFIGSPKINILPGRIASGGLIDAAGWSPARVTGIAEGARIDLGIRPEDLEIVRPDHPAALRARVRTVEFLGSELLLNLTPDGGAAGDGLIVRTGPDRVDEMTIGTTVHVAAAPPAIHLFGADGRRLADDVRATEVAHG